MDEARQLALEFALFNNKGDGFEAKMIVAEAEEFLAFLDPPGSPERRPYEEPH